MPLVGLLCKVLAKLGAGFRGQGDRALGADLRRVGSQDVRDRDAGPVSELLSGGP